MTLLNSAWRVSALSASFMNSTQHCFVAVIFAGVSFATAATLSPVFFPWDRGIAVRIPGAPEADMYLWFYEWNLFEAMRSGSHSGSLVFRDGTYQLRRIFNDSATEATLSGPELHLTLRSAPGGADLTLRILNATEWEWPDIAAIIPCWSPGKTSGSTHRNPTPANANFADPDRARTWFVAANGLTRLDSRAIHFNAQFRAAIDRASENGTFVFSSKWPTSEVNATAGLLLRESEDGRWIAGIAWEDFLTVQGHNPWNCMHLGIRVGPLKPRESQTVRGKLYLFQGTKEECVARFRHDFPNHR